MQTKTVTCFRKISTSTCVSDLATFNKTSTGTVLNVRSPMAICFANVMFKHKSDRPVTVMPDG